MSSRNRGWSLGGCLFFLVLIGVALITLITLAVSVWVAVMLGTLLAQVIALVFQWFFSPQPRPFGAWQESRWTLTYEQGLYILEQWTGISFVRSPFSLLIGCWLLSQSTLLGLHLCLWVLGIHLAVWLLAVLGFGIGFLTALNLMVIPTHFLLPGGGGITPDSHLSPQDLTFMGGD